MNYFEEFFKKQDSLLKEVEELDEVCKRKKQIIGRYVLSYGLSDRTSYYIVVDETPRKYLLRFACGESVDPIWGHEIKLRKKEVQLMIKGRDYLSKIFPSRH